MKRNKLKTIFLHVIVITIIGGLFCHGFIMGSSVSGVYNYICYAEADNWSSCDSSDLVTAFRYYCKSRNLAIEGSAADALTTFTTTTFNNICATLGIDPTSLQAELKKTTQGNLGLRFLFSNTGITAYNRIFAEFLQNNDLEVGESVDNKNVYSGKTYIDPDGNKCLVWVFPTRYNQSLNSVKPIYVGSHYKYTSSQLYNFYLNSVRPVYNFGINQSDNAYLYNYSDQYYSIYQFSNDRTLISDQFRNSRREGGNVNADGSRIIGMVQGSEQLYFGSACYFWDLVNPNYPDTYYAWGLHVPINNYDPDNVDPVDVTVDTPDNTVINNNTYNNNFTIIYNDGDTYISDDDDEPLPTTPPGGGGDDPGGGDPSDPDDWNPTVPDIPDPDTPDFPTIDLPDIDIPDLPSLDFSLGDLRHKFPFSLPFDIIAVLNVLDGEPQAPVIDATIPIGSWYTWEFHADFSEFDNYARIFRAFEFIGFVIGLAVFTVHFAKG